MFLKVIKYKTYRYRLKDKKYTQHNNTKYTIQIQKSTQVRILKKN